MTVRISYVGIKCLTGSIAQKSQMLQFPALGDAAVQKDYEHCDQ